MQIMNKIFTLADGSYTKLDKSVTLPVKICNVTYNVNGSYENQLDYLIKCYWF